jgi:hypothetical protein
MGLRSLQKPLKDKYRADPKASHADAQAPAAIRVDWS